MAQIQSLYDFSRVKQMSWWIKNHLKLQLSFSSIAVIPLCHSSGSHEALSRLLFLQTQGNAQNPHFHPPWLSWLCAPSFSLSGCFHGVQCGIFTALAEQAKIVVINN